MISPVGTTLLSVAHIDLTLCLSPLLITPFTPMPMAFLLVKVCALAACLPPGSVGL